MSHFSTALEAAIERDGRAKQEIAARLGMNQSQFSRYCSARGSVGSAVVEKIVNEFPEEDQARLWKGFLMDEVPEHQRHLINIDARTGALAEAAPDGLDDLPEEVRSALRFIGSKCTDLPVRAMILNFAKILRGQQPVAHMASTLHASASASLAAKASHSGDTPAPTPPTRTPPAQR